MTDLSFRPLRPHEDAPLLHGWFTQLRGRFWGMGDKSVDEVRDVYDFVDSLEAHWAWIGEKDGRPVALVQTYEPEHDPVAEAYAVRSGDPRRAGAVRLRARRASPPRGQGRPHGLPDAAALRVAGPLTLAGRPGGHGRIAKGARTVDPGPPRERVWPWGHAHLL
ncbi:acetyltransferase [Janibacter limosus]|uniref:Acetyltransferase n=2 Tax=Janibacter limosus TaxID=53458 RepID=A0AC61U573_9MICO|nr:acetyltransferase [Janibacter limosus]UUZ44967.1 acetyltransferase [Janibacter limosus]